jgi:hypothetical protein
MTYQDVLEELGLPALSTRPGNIRPAAWLARVGADDQLTEVMESMGHLHELLAIQASLDRHGPRGLSIGDIERFGITASVLRSWDEDDALVRRAVFVEACLRVLGLDRVEDLD